VRIGGLQDEEGDLVKGNVSTLQYTGFENRVRREEKQQLEEEGVNFTKQRVGESERISLEKKREERAIEHGSQIRRREL